MDEETGAKVWTCSLVVGKATLSITLAELPTASAAGKVLTEMADEEHDDELVPDLEEEPGWGGRRSQRSERGGDSVNPPVRRSTWGHRS